MPPKTNILRGWVFSSRLAAWVFGMECRPGLCLLCGVVLIYPVGMFESGGISWRELVKPGIGIRETDPQLELERLAQATGTKAHFPTDIEQCKASMKEIAREVSPQYSVGYWCVPNV